MGLIDRIRLLSRDNRKIRQEISAILLLEDDERYAQLGHLLHHICVQCAARFTQDEFGKGTSPFAVLEKGRLFHEFLLLDYWLVDRMISDKKRAVVGEIFKQYLTSFQHLSGRPAGDLSQLHERFGIFSANWDDETGHQDIFAEEASKVILGEAPTARVNEINYLIIDHAHTVKRKLRDVKNICMDSGLRLKEKAQPAPAPV